MATTLRINILVDAARLPELMQSGYNLCITNTIQVDGREVPGNVVRADRRFAMNNCFNIDERYRVFAANQPQPGAMVQAMSNEQDIQGGQTATFDQNMIMDSPEGSFSPGEAFQVKNSSGMPTSFAIGNHQNGEFSVIFVSTPVLGSAKFLPTKKFSVFWARELETNTIIDHSSTDNAFSFDLTDRSQISIQYQADGTWSVLD